MSNCSCILGSHRFDVDEPGPCREVAGGGEVDLDDFNADKFDHECPRCGFRF